jgi:post-segregation antitoxin (ccd killing protein)
MRFVPQIYYLKMDESDGFYFTSSLTLARRNFPITVSALINKTIQTEISASKDFVWNASLIYSFNNRYVKAQ